MQNLQIRQFRELIITTTNESQLPIEIKRLVFVEVLQQIQETADNEIREELIASKEDVKKEGVEDGESVQSNTVDK